MTEKVIDRETYRKVKKMSREELQAFLMRYAENLIKELDAESNVPIIDLKAMEADIRQINGIGEKRCEQIMNVIEKHLGVSS